MAPPRDGVADVGSSSPISNKKPKIVTDITGSVSLETTIAGIDFPKAICNSSNPFATSVQDLQLLADSPATGAFATRTACPNFVHDDAKHQWREFSKGNTINCLGYSCHSFDYYLEAIPKVQESHPDKPAILSISGYAGEVADMLKKAAAAFANNKSKVLVEINLSCPNIPGKPPIAYDFTAMQEYLTTVLQHGNHRLAVGVKLTPYFYDGQFVEAARVLNEFYPQLAFVTCINTVGCGLVVDVETEAPVLAGASGASYGGLGGPAVHATALGNVRRLRQLLRPELDIIGCGGVDCGAAAFRHLLCGANVVMVASALITQGVGVLEKIESELMEIMKQKGYCSIEDFRGKLKDKGDGEIQCPQKRED